MGLCQRHHQPDGGGIPDTHGTDGSQSVDGAVRLLRRLRHDGHSRRPVYQEVQLQERHPFRLGTVCHGSLPLYSSGSRAELPILLPVTLYSHLRLGVPRNYRQPLHPVVRRQGDKYAQTQLRTILQPHGIALRHERGFAHRPATTLERPSRRGRTRHLRYAFGSREGRHPPARPGHHPQSLCRHRPCCGVYVRADSTLH